ncbi:MAG: FecR family protein [Mangrovibacterium sp.]
MRKKKDTVNPETVLERFRTLEWLHELLRRYYGQEATDREREIVERWNPEPQGLVTDEKIRNSPYPLNKESVWAFLVEELDLYDRNGRKIRFLTRFQKYAALIICILAIGGGVYLSRQYHNRSGKSGESFMVQAPVPDVYYRTGKDEIKDFMLADGSRIKLNQGSRLAILKGAYNKEKREVWLEEGEVFFEVAKDPAKPFVVHSGDLQVVVRGTEFNVKAYHKLSRYTVSVRQGKVEVGTADKLFGTLTDNRQLNFDMVEGDHYSCEIKWTDACGWMDGRLVLDKADLKELKLRIAQQFGKDLVIRGNLLQDISVSSSFEKGASLEEVMETIGAVYNINYRISGKQVIILN